MDVVSNKENHQKTLDMDTKKKKYEAPLVKIRTILVENGFSTSSTLEGFQYGDNIDW